MSGPKVIHVVTREEVLATCRGHLARLDCALSAWERLVTRNSLADEAEIAAMKARRDRIASLLEADRLSDLQKMAPEMLGWLETDKAERLERAASARAKEKRAIRSLQTTAGSLLASLARGSVAVPEDLRSQLQAARCTNPAEKTRLEACVARGFELLSAGGTPGAADRQRELARALQGPGSAPQSLEAWLATHGHATEEDPRFEVVDRHAAQLVALSDAAGADAILRQAESLRNQTDVARFSLLLDALCLDAAHRVKAASEASVVRQGAASLEAQAEAQGDATWCKAAVADIESRLASGHLEAARALLESLEAERDRRARAQAALARREAVLAGLRSLGYEVTEGMATAWANGGRVVLKHPSTENYGLEVGGNAEVGRLQVRTVAIEGSARDPGRDKDAEVRWCGDLDRLKAVLAKAGGDLAVEKAVPAGAQPLKVVADEWRDEDDLEGLRAMNNR